jgi:hypothetical protein
LEPNALRKSDPTDSALAAIASILDHPERRDEPAKAAVEEKPAATPQPIEANGYRKTGPGPMAAIRFKWTVRQVEGDYYVEETIGDSSAPVMSGPMAREAAIKFVDDRESDARRRFEDLKREMAGRGAANLVLRAHGLS